MHIVKTLNINTNVSTNEVIRKYNRLLSEPFYQDLLSKTRPVQAYTPINCTEAFMLLQ